MPSQVQLIAAEDGYAVVWRTGASNAGVTHVARIASDGALRGTHVLGEGGDHHSPRAVWTSDGFAVAWSQVDAGQTRIRFLELDAAGIPKSSEASTLATVDKVRSYPELVWTGEQNVIAWLSGSLADDTGKTHLVKLSRAGQRVGQEIEVAGYFAGLAWMGDGLALLTYVNSRGRDLVQITTAIGDVTTPSTVQLTLMNPELQVFAASGLKQALGINEFGRPLVWDGQSLTFLWGGDRHVNVGQFTCESTPLL